MGFGKNKWLKILGGHKERRKLTEVRASTSSKNKDGENETDFSGFIRLVGDAHKAAKNIDEGDRIRIQACETTNSYNKEKGITYWNCTVFKFDGGEEDTEQEASDSKSDSTSSSKDNSKESDMPW